MTSVRNHRLLLNGNKWLIFFLAATMAACSPKVRQTPKPTPIPPPPTEKNPSKPEKPVEKKPVKKHTDKPASISMILPLGLDQLRPGQQYSAANLTKANMAAEYYQGFKLALDSLATSTGTDYKLEIFDSKDRVAEAHSLGYNPRIRSSDLIVGPVFPEDIKAFTSVLASAKQPIVSPLSPSAPSTYKNPHLLTMTPPLEYHAAGAATYVFERLRPKKIFILKSGYSEDNDYIIPFKKTIDSLSNKHIQVISTTVVHGDLKGLMPQLSRTADNIFIIPSTKQAFLTITLRSLEDLSDEYPVQVFGHPNWEKLTYLKAAQLQHVNTHITSSYKVDYKSVATVVFLRNYRRAYHTEPTEYAIKGFDEGLYLGQLLADGDDHIKKPDEYNYLGLHNDFHFVKVPGQGWVNAHVDILKYENFELKRAE
ncbi:ABC transporter substrate-binding protein [Mucilaginibacter segetis]|uniref:Amino acid ABC transporter substrate-binding protein n=1 Tax=Mucilaginibacter segetis TaxID=2793071 RepID=A0A934UNG4_9SPHI|nr:ABC transporter substrate-binding protein [Mucilaginibacter segetis]MBK0380768.1 amino acid ABC transporter substrate-binding protein [Mucilaginibacter segetis]